MTTPRVLAGLTADRMTHRAHAEIHGRERRSSAGRLRGEIEASGLRGRGGGAFPLSGKIDAVTRRRGRPVLVVNACEGEPMSGKDRVLLRHLPHLVIDGALALAEIVGARRILCAVERHDSRSGDSVARALVERPSSDGSRRIELVGVPSGYVSGQETALVNWCNHQLAAPTTTRVAARGVGGRPTLVSNAETLAHVALIAHHGAAWFREAGTPEDPGTTLVTLGGAVGLPGVYEVEHGASLASLVNAAGGPSAQLAGALIGGYAGGWLAPERVRGLRLDRASIVRVGARLGAGIIVLLPTQACPVAETARVAGWMAQQGAGQCGPCAHGLRAIAAALDAIREGRDGRRALADVARWSGQVAGRGACAHPDGAVGMIASALGVFGAEFLEHADGGPCDGCDRPAVLDTPSRRHPSLPR